MQVTLPEHPTTSAADAELHLGYLWMIAFVAALGGLLFGYDWVVIGGAKPFYQAYFNLRSDAAIGWANSCALVGCFIGSMLAGQASDRMGRKKVLILSALLFAVSSVLTGWAPVFAAFIAWRITGGVAIGVASIVSPMYIAEISPAKWRGRLVSLNQLALVTGILAAQIANWLIARPVPPGLHGVSLASTWNAQYAWRWMFTAVAVPAAILLVTAPFIPESPRWLLANEKVVQARSVLHRIGGSLYATQELRAIQEARVAHRGDLKWHELLARPGRKLLIIGIVLAVLQQGTGINILFNYAQDIYHSAGYGLNGIMLNIVITGLINLIFTIVAMLMVDRFGRRRLMIFGCLAIGASQLAASLAYRLHLGGTWVLVLTLCAIACYAMSLAPVTWILITEIFPNRIRAAGVSVSIAMLWVASFLLTYTFPFLNQHVGTPGAFQVYGGICLAGAVFVALEVKETKGRSLENLEDFVA